MSMMIIDGQYILTTKDKKTENEIEKALQEQKALMQLLSALGSAGSAGASPASMLDSILSLLSACEDDAKKMIGELEDLENKVMAALDNSGGNPMVIAEEKALAKKEIDALIQEAQKLKKEAQSMVQMVSGAKNNPGELQSLAAGLENVLEQKLKLEESMGKIENELQKLIMQNSKAFSADEHLLLSENIDSAANVHKKQTDTLAAQLQSLEESLAKLNLLQKQEASQSLNNEGVGKTGSGHTSQHFGGSLAG